MKKARKDLSKYKDSAIRILAAKHGGIWAKEARRRGLLGEISENPRKTRKTAHKRIRKTAPKTRKKIRGTGGKIISLGGFVDFILGD